MTILIVREDGEELVSDLFTITVSCPTITPKTDIDINGIESTIYKTTSVTDDFVTVLSPYPEEHIYTLEADGCPRTNFRILDWGSDGTVGGAEMVTFPDAIVINTADGELLLNKIHLLDTRYIQLIWDYQDGTEWSTNIFAL